MSDAGGVEGKTAAKLMAPLCTDFAAQNFKGSEGSPTGVEKIDILQSGLFNHHESNTSRDSRSPLHSPLPSLPIKDDKYIVHCPRGEDCTLSSTKDNFVPPSLDDSFKPSSDWNHSGLSGADFDEGSASGSGCVGLDEFGPVIIHNLLRRGGDHDKNSEKGDILSAMGRIDEELEKHRAVDSGSDRNGILAADGSKCEVDDVRGKRRLTPTDPATDDFHRVTLAPELSRGIEPENAAPDQVLPRSVSHDRPDDSHKVMSEEEDDLEIWVFCLPQSEACCPDDESCVTFGEDNCLPAFMRGVEVDGAVVPSIEEKLENSTVNSDSNEDHGDSELTGGDFADDGSSVPFVEPSVGGCPFAQANQVTAFAIQKEEVMGWIRLQLPCIQQPDLDNYSRRLIEDGFDSIHFIEQELTIDDVDFMKKAHKRAIARTFAAKPKFEAGVDTSGSLSSSSSLSSSFLSSSSSFSSDSGVSDDERSQDAVTFDKQIGPDRFDMVAASYMRRASTSAMPSKKKKQTRIGLSLKTTFVGRGRNQSVRVAQSKEEDDSAGTAPTAESTRYARRNSAPARSQSNSAGTAAESKNTSSRRLPIPFAHKNPSPATGQSKTKPAHIIKPGPSRKPSKSRRSRMIPRVTITPLASELGDGYLHMRAK